jgi:hypothetical protein
MSTEKIISYDEVKQQEKKNLKFLKQIISEKDINRVNLDLIYEEHLVQLDKYLKKIGKKFKNEIGDAAS